MPAVIFVGADDETVVEELQRTDERDQCCGEEEEVAALQEGSGAEDAPGEGERWRGGR